MGAHLDAVEKAVGAACLGPLDQPVVEIARSLARRMDAAEATSEGPGSRLYTSYLTAVRTLAARAAVGRPARPAPAESVAAVEQPVQPEEVPGADVLNFRVRNRGRRQAG